MKLYLRRRNSINALVAAISLTVMFLLGSVDSAVYRESTPAPTANSHVAAFGPGWMTTLQNYERAYCLTPVLPNTTVTLTGSSTVADVTNLTGSSAGPCAGLPPRVGIAEVIYYRGMAAQVTFSAYNNSTSVSNALFDQYDFLSTTVGILGTSEFLQLQSNYSLGNTTKLKMMVVACCVVGGNGGSGTGYGDTGTDNGTTTSSGGGGCPTGGTAPVVYIWDSICFSKNFPVLYPHPYRTYYGIYANTLWQISGTKLEHTQLGTNMVGAFVSLPSTVVGAVLGGIIGGELGSIVGATYGGIVGGIAGAFIGGILTYTTSTTFFDEANTVWDWFNNAFYSALSSPPTYIGFILTWWGMYTAAATFWYYLLSLLDYTRVGSHTIINSAGITGP